MGRPLSKEFFGTTGPDIKHIQLQANLGTGIVFCWIVKQTGTRKYIATDGTSTHKVILKETINNIGDATLTITKFDGSTSKVKTLEAHIVKTFQDETLKWSFDAPTPDIAQIASNSGPVPSLYPLTEKGFYWDPIQQKMYIWNSDETTATIWPGTDILPGTTYLSQVFLPSVFDLGIDGGATNLSTFSMILVSSAANIALSTPVFEVSILSGSEAFQGAHSSDIPDLPQSPAGYYISIPGQSASNAVLWKAGAKLNPIPENFYIVVTKSGSTYSFSFNGETPIHITNSNNPAILNFPDTSMVPKYGIFVPRIVTNSEITKFVTTGKLV